MQKAPHLQPHGGPDTLRDPPATKHPTGQNRTKVLCSCVSTAREGEKQQKGKKDKGRERERERKGH